MRRTQIGQWWWTAAAVVVGALVGWQCRNVLAWLIVSRISDDAAVSEAIGDAVVALACVFVGVTLVSVGAAIVAFGCLVRIFGVRSFGPVRPWVYFVLGGCVALLMPAAWYLSDTML